MRLPRWDCRSDRERRAFEDWTNVQLDRRLADEMNRSTEEGLADMERALSDDPPSLATHRMMLEEILERAILSKDREKILALLRLASYQELMAERYARKRGRRPIKNAEIARRRSLIKEHIKWIREIWKEHYSRRNRTPNNPPSAEAIILRRFEARGWHLTPRDLGLKTPPF